MNGPNHYRNAERLMHEANSVEFHELRKEKISLAQIHATLALAAAHVSPTLCDGFDDWLDIKEAEEWREALNERFVAKASPNAMPT